MRDSNASFATTPAAFEMLYDMMLGGLPEGWVEALQKIANGEDRCRKKQALSRTAKSVIISLIFSVSVVS